MKKAAILARGLFATKRAKTAHGLIRHGSRYKIVEVIDETLSGKDAGEVINGSKIGIPIVSKLGDGGNADALILGIAPPGGMIPPEYLSDIKEAINRGMDIVSGAHTFLSDVPEIRDLAKKHGVNIWDVRKPPVKMHTATFKKIDIPVILTAAPDSSLGKRTAALEIVRHARDMGMKTAYIATGQTGILIGCDRGVVLDHVPGDFISGVMEEMVMGVQEDGFDLAVVEGQGSVSHVAYGPVALGILYGCRPDHIVMVWDPFRNIRDDYNGQKIPTPREEFNMIKALHSAANLAGIGLRTMGVMDDDDYTSLKEQVESEYTVPAAYFLRDPEGGRTIVRGILDKVTGGDG